MLRQETESLIVNQANEVWTTHNTWSSEFEEAKFYGTWQKADRTIKHYQAKGVAEFAGARSLTCNEYFLMMRMAPRGEAQSQGGEGWVKGLAFFVGADSTNTYWHVYALRNHLVLGEETNYMRSFTCTPEEAAQAYADEIFHSIMAVC